MAGKALRGGAVFSADNLGVAASTLCFLHCLFTPILLSLSAVSAHFLPSEERTHRILAVAIAMLGGLAFVSGYRKHRKLRVPVSMGIGIALVFAAALWGDSFPSHWVEVAVTMTGSFFMIAGHRMNHTFCKACTRCD